MKAINLKKYNLIIGLIILGFFSSSVQAYDPNNKLGSFKNNTLQEIIEKPFYLFGDDKDNAIPFYLKEFLNWDYEVVYDPDYISEVEDPFISHEEDLMKNGYLEITQTFKEKLHYRKSSNIYIKKDEVKQFLESISKDINQDPVNARFKIDPETKEVSVLKRSQEKIELKTSESFQKIKNTLIENFNTSYIPLEIDKSPPEISSENPEQYEIKELIGVGESDFTGSSSTRIHNIKTGAKRFDGLVLKPEEELSFTTILGEVDETTGYKEELVIKKNKTVPEYGGGICQISTTMFRSALNSGMKITERHNHSYPVHYYDPPGTDATIYVPRPDLKFKNNTGNYLLLQTEIDEDAKEFFIKFYSKEDLYEVEIEGPEVTERTADGKLRTSLKQIVKNAETGEEIFQDIFKSFYDNPDNYPSPDKIVLEKPEDWSGKQWDEYYAKFGAIIEEMKKEN